MTRGMACSTLLLAIVLVIVAPWAHAVDVGSCDQFAAVDRRTETEVTVTTADFKCDTYTRLSIRTDMVLKSTVGKVTFTNLALKVYGSLIIEPDVVFTGVSLVRSNGGALKLELGAVGVFKGTADFNGNSIVATELPSTDDDSFRRFSQAGRKGGAVHNKGNLTFEKDATFVDNQNIGGGYGEGGALSVHVKGSVHFMGNLNVTVNSNLNDLDDGQDVDVLYNLGEGGGIYNLGDIVVDGEALFLGNAGGQGGAIYQDQWATSVFNGFATFTENQCTNTHGGAIANFGGEVTFEAGSLFFGNFAGDSDGGGYGGGIYNGNGGVVTLKGSTTFRQNIALWGAGIFSEEDPDRRNDGLLVYPEDTIFEDNIGEHCIDVAFDFDENTCGL